MFSKACKTKEQFTDWKANCGSCVRWVGLSELAARPVLSDCGVGSAARRASQVTKGAPSFSKSWETLGSWARRWLVRESCCCNVTFHWGRKELHCLYPHDSEHIYIRKNHRHYCAALIQPPQLWCCRKGSTFPRGRQVLTWRHRLLKYQWDHLVHLLAKIDIFGCYRQKDKCLNYCKHYLHFSKAHVNLFSVLTHTYDTISSLTFKFFSSKIQLWKSCYYIKATAVSFKSPVALKTLQNVKQLHTKTL